MYKKIKRMLRAPFETAGAVVAVAAISLLPRRAMLAVCDFASALMWAFDGRGRRRAHENLAVVFGRELPPDRERKIVRRSYRNMARSVGHMVWTCRKARVRAAQSAELDARSRAFLAANKPCVTVSGHIGCWEVLSQLAFLEGHEIISVAKDVGTSAITRLLVRARKSIGQEIIPVHGAFRPLLKGLKSGKTLGLLIDQAVRPSDGGIWVRFFGRPVPVSPGPAFFACKCSVPIAVAWSRPLKDGRYVCETVAEYSPQDARDVWGVTQRCILDLENVIRRHPSCWVLNYNAFRKHPKPGELEQLAERERKWKQANEQAPAFPPVPQCFSR